MLDGMPEKRDRSYLHTHDKILQRYIRRTIQDADRMFDRMGPDEFRLTVQLMERKKTFEDVRESVMTAIGRLEVLHRRLTECKASLPSQTAATPKPGPEPIRSKAVKPSVPEFVYSNPMKCPKCNVVGGRFKRRSDADPQKDYWICQTKGCQLKISHYNIKIDRTFQPAETAAAG